MADQNQADQDSAEQEQSMEEILASIRKIISEDEPIEEGEPDEAATADGGDEDDDILDLSEPLPDDDFMDEVAAAEGEADDEAMEADVGDDIDELMLVDQEMEPEPAPEPPPPAPQPAPPPAADGGLLSPEAAALSASALSSLQSGVLRTDAGIGDGNTVEGIVRELLRPMMKQWLDVHLPSMVENLVREEIQRIQREGRD